ncbi:MULTISPECIES: hypothetical protein [Pseudomonas]|uniref:hypothetical protein n=1 Tax=Pseudomonas TaxID=286 RepID=UPI00090911E4|nr:MULTISPECIES: hypothetical protein [Pseudomonas]TCV68204.1 hypothetical protein EDB98_10374 [Pseudomonas fluorescens]SFW47842.1 hypothetical protein SAMN03159439_02128 [Pseudomonas sp. NFACC04-2]
MKICDQCRSVISDENAACPRCAEKMRRSEEALALTSQPSKGLKILKWVFISTVVAVLAAVAVVVWIFNSLGPMPSFG